MEWKRANKQRLLVVRRDADVEDRSRWPEYYDWLTNKLERFHRVMGPRVKALDLEGEAVATE